MRLFKVALLSLFDVIRHNYAYHSGALTYHFMLSMAPMTIVLLNLISFLPVLDIEKVEATLENMLPQYTGVVVREILEVQKRSHETSLIALSLAYFFSVGFIKYLGRAFSFVSDGRLGGKRELFYWVFMPVFLLGAILVILTFFFLSLFVKVMIPKDYIYLIDLIYMFPGTVVVAILYKSFLKSEITLLRLITTSLYISALMFLTQLAFTWYIANLFRGSLLYGSLSTVIVFLLWINLIFLTLLYGARMLSRLEE
jgi:membrane protein